MGFLTGIGSAIKKLGSQIRGILSGGKAPPAVLDHIEPHFPKEKFHKISNKFIDEYGFTIKNAKDYAKRALGMDPVDLTQVDRDIIAEFSP